jgi:flagellar biosynthesis chaperone FliJ
MKSLATLIKLQKTRVDEQRQTLAKAQEFLDGVAQAIAQLEIKKAREQTAAEKHPEARLTYGAFLKAAVRDGRALEKQRAVAEAAVEAARAKLAELFEEQKRYEIAAAHRQAAEDREGRRKETIELDEVGGVTYTRNKT